MDKNAIKKYAVWARKELIARVTQKAEQYEITEKKTTPADADSIGGRVLTAAEKKQRQALIAKINQEGFEQVMEEVAYTWFNRFTALRFMEVNNYLPSHTRVFTNENGEFKPQILADAIQLDLEGLNMDKVFELKDANKTEELYKYLLITQCNALSGILPRMFQKIEDYTELLLPDYLLREGSVTHQMIALIPKEDWMDQVQIIGWLYQYYIAEPKDEKINTRKQYNDQDIPIVTQLFTTDWIVRFIVENSLGRLWVESHPNCTLQKEWEYYVEEDDSVAEKDINPEDLTCIDPCSGSGHIVAYIFDILIQIYESYGYTRVQAVDAIISKNIYAIDIDERAAQLSYFSVMMKARQYDRRFFKKKLQPHVYTIEESNEIDRSCVEYFINGDESLKKGISEILHIMKNAKKYGSLITVDELDFDLLYERVNEVITERSLFSDPIEQYILPLIKVAEILSRKYSVVITNPPYMGTKYMPTVLRDYVSDNYSDYKSDLFSAFLVRCQSMCLPQGHMGLLTPYVWMFLGSYEKLRNYLLKNVTFSSLVQLEYNAFEAACVPVSAFTFRNETTKKKFGCIKLSEFRGSENQAPKTREAIKNRNCGYRFLADQDDFYKIPGMPIAYWVSENFVDAFSKGISIDDISNFTGSQHKTADNDKYLRLHWEVPATEIDQHRWIFYAKGGDFRKWYGNNDYVVDWSAEARQFYSSNPTSNMIKEQYWYKEGITYTSLTSASANGFRYLPPIGVFDIKGPSIVDVKDLEYCLGFFNSKVAQVYLGLLNPTVTLQVKDVKNTPLLIDESKKQRVKELVKECIEVEKEDWNSYETSWEFEQHPLLGKGLLSEIYCAWEKTCNDRFNLLKRNEEELNKMFIEIYGIQDELSYELQPDEITSRKAERDRDVKSLISYAVGCMFGRYSLDVPGLAHRGGALEENKYHTFIPDKDGIIPICNEEYFNDDITSLFIKFIEAVYGDKYLEDNLKFIADSLGGKGSSRQIIRTYFLNGFYNDHCNMYSITGSGKRPIYWQFDSGKKNGFKCLIYIHRYKADTIARIRTDYVHEQQSRYRTAIAEFEQLASSSSTGDRVRLNKALKLLKDQDEEIRKFEEKIHHLADKMIALNIEDGVKKNYVVLKDVLTKIK